VQSFRAIPALFAAMLALFLAGPARAGDDAARELEGTLRAIVSHGAMSGARVGVLVADVESGQVLYAKDPDVLLNPASNVKLVTSAAALARLGPEFRFDTELYVDAASAGSGAPKTLYVKGKGDPSLFTERMWALAGDLAHLGIRQVGEIVVDESFFDGERFGPGFDQETGDKSYLAPTGAASLNWNTVAVHVGPGDRKGAKARVDLEPASDLFEVDVRATTVAPRARRRLTVSSTPAGARQRIVVEGRIPQGSRIQVVWRRIDEPGLYLGHTLRRLLELRGVKTAGKVKLGEIPQGARLVHVDQSESLGEIVRRLNKTSNNFVAEQLVKTLGAQVKGGPGSWAKGIQVIEEFLAEVGIPRGAYLMKNGSGLNDTNRFSARQLATLLRAMWARFPLHAEYVASLPVAGRDGTIRWRMEGTEAVGRLRAKTGTLENVTSLSGYVETAGHRTLAFSILVNDFAGRPGGLARSVDAIGAALAASGGAPGAVGAAVALAKGTPAQTSPAVAPADLTGSLATYYALGRAGDPRNLQFLRTALRTETDPALRLAIAECVYLSEPDGETSRRTFLDAVPQDPQVLARLWTAVGESAAGAPAPVIPSLGDLAAEGLPDALSRLVELAPAGAVDGKIAATFADVMGDVASMAPEELVAALHGASPAAEQAAIGALGAGALPAAPPSPAAPAEERERPFLAALRAMAEQDGEQGAYAKALKPRVEAAIVAAAAARAAPAIVPAGGNAPAQAAPVVIPAQPVPAKATGK
jgi:D-alanyl-D-alanine carboxypeptidase/D-alanyl-D-alanine-endopeptidase (penicillin-binding protein 4)